MRPAYVGSRIWIHLLCISGSSSLVPGGGMVIVIILCFLLALSLSLSGTLWIYMGNRGEGFFQQIHDG